MAIRTVMGPKTRAFCCRGAKGFLIRSLGLRQTVLTFSIYPPGQPVTESCGIGRPDTCHGLASSPCRIAVGVPVVRLAIVPLGALLVEEELILGIRDQGIVDVAVLVQASQPPQAESQQGFSHSPALAGVRVVETRREYLIQVHTQSRSHLLCFVETLDCEDQRFQWWRVVGQTRLDDRRGVRLRHIEPDGFVPPAIRYLADQLIAEGLALNVRGGQIFLERQMSEPVNAVLALDEQTARILDHLEEIFAAGVRFDLFQSCLDDLGGLGRADFAALGLHHVISQRLQNTLLLRRRHLEFQSPGLLPFAEEDFANLRI